MRTIKILCVNDPWDIVGKTTGDADTKDFSHLEQEMNDYYSQPSAPYLKVLRKEQVCVGKRSKDDRWYRLKIKEIFKAPDGDKAKCFQLDYGQTVNYPETVLYELLPRFQRVAYQAKRFCIADVQPVTLVTSHEDLTTYPMPVSEWDEVGKKTFKRILLGAERTEVELLESRGNVNFVDLYVVREDVPRFSVKEELIRLSRAIHNTGVFDDIETQEHRITSKELGGEVLLNDTKKQLSVETMQNALTSATSLRLGVHESRIRDTHEEKTANAAGIGNVSTKPRVIGRGRPGCQPVPEQLPNKSVSENGIRRIFQSKEIPGSSYQSEIRFEDLSPDPQKVKVKSLLPIPGRGRGLLGLSPLAPLPGNKGAPQCSYGTDAKQKSLGRGNIFSALAIVTPNKNANKQTSNWTKGSKSISSDVPNIFRPAPRKDASIGGCGDHRKTHSESISIFTTKPTLGRGHSLRALVNNKSQESVVGLSRQIGNGVQSSNPEIEDSLDDPDIDEPSFSEDMSPNRMSTSPQVNFNDHEQVCHFSSMDDILGTRSSESATIMVPRPILKKDKNPLMMLQKCEDSDSDTIGNRLWEEQLMLVCEVCKGNHETNNENCPGFDRNQRAICFKGHTCVLSNMYPCTVCYNGNYFKSSEHAYQWTKARKLGYSDLAKEIFDASDGYTTKRLVETIDGKHSQFWRKNYAVAALKQIAQAKFDSVDEFREVISKSKGMYIIESTLDTFWGVGFLADIAEYCRPQYWPGENVMGRILMELRDKHLGVAEELLPYKEIGRLVREKILSDPLDVPVLEVCEELESTSRLIEDENESDNDTFTKELEASIPCTELMKQFSSQKPQELVSAYDNQGVTAKKSVNCFDLGLLVDSEEMPVCRTKLRDINLHQFIKNKFSDEAITASQIVPLWMYSWPSILRGRNFIGIAPQDNVKKSYLPALMSVVLQGSNLGLPKGTNPRVVILVPSWKVAQEIYYECHQLIGRIVKQGESVLAIYGGGYEETQEIPLLNGCSVLVATPHCLLRMLDKNILNLKRLCHLALHDGEKLLQDFSEQVHDIMGRWNEEKQDGLRLNKQIILISSVWTLSVDAFVKKHAPDPVICIGSKSEAAVYGGLKIVAEMCKSSNRLDRLKEIMSTVIDRTIVFTNSKESAHAAFELLKASSVYAIIADGSASGFTLENVSQQWNGAFTEGSCPVLVATDDILTKVKIEKAQRVIHFDLPKSKGTFNERLWCMRQNFLLPLLKSNANDSTCCVSNILVTENAKRQVPTLLRIIKHMDVEIPRALLQFSEETMKGRQEKHNKLCSEFKAFGKCMNESNCLRRHIINKEKDSPNSNPKFVKIPTCGRVKIKVTCVKHASEYWVRLLEHDDRGKKNVLSNEYATLCMKLNLYYGKISNRNRCECVVLNDFCALEDTQHCFNRVVIEEVGPLNKFGDYTEVLARLVDTGEVRWVTVSDLYQLTPQFVKVPFQAVEVFACKVKPYDNDSHFTEKATRYVSETILQKELEGKVVLSLGHTMWLDPLVNRQYLRESGVVVDNFAVHEDLIDMNLAMKNPGHMNGLYAASEAANIELPEILHPASQPCFGFNSQGLPVSFRTVEFPKESGYHPVQIQAVEHPGLFYVRLLKHRSMQSDLEVSLQDHIKLHSFDSNRNEDIKVGSLVLAQLDLEEDDMWYRGKVISLSGQKTCEVLYLDHGDKDFVQIDTIKPLQARFLNQPFLAIECSLAFLSPDGDTWSDESSDLLWSLTGSERVLMAKVIETCEGRRLGYTHYKVELIDTNSETDKDIAQELIASGYARPTKELAEVTISQKIASESVKNGQCAQISSLCEVILAVQDPDEQYAIAEQIKNIIMKNPTGFEEIRLSGGLRSLCQLIGYVKDTRVQHVLFACITDLVGADSENCNEICRSRGVLNAINIFGRIEDSERLRILKYLLKWSENFLIGEYLVKNGMLNILSEYIKTCEDEETLFTAIDLLSSLVQHVDDDGTFLLNSGCVDALLQLVTRISGANLHRYCLRCLTDVIGDNSVVVDYLRREGHLKTKICALFDSSSDVEVQKAYLALLHALTLSDRQAREIIVNSLSEKSLRQMMKDSSGQVRETCIEMLKMMHCPLPNDDENSEESKLVLDVRKVSSQPCSKYSSKSSQVQKYWSPEVLWTQNRHSIALTVKIEDSTGFTSDCVRGTENTINFRAFLGDAEYSFEFHLYELIYPESKQLNVTPKSVEIGFHKKNRGRWPRLLRDKVKAYRQLRPDLEHYIDSESESDSESELESVCRTENLTSQLPLNILRRKKQRSREMTFPSDIGPPVDYNATAEPLPYSDSDDPDIVKKIKDGLDSDEESDIDLHHNSLCYQDDFNLFGVN